MQDFSNFTGKILVQPYKYIHFKLNNIMGLKYLVEDVHEELDFIVEEKNKTGERKTFIQGPFMMAGNTNGNGRVYNIDEMIGEVNRYNTEMILTRRAIGEMNHPQSTEVNPVNACHLVVELKQRDNYFMGKSQVLSTPMGKLLENFIHDNIKMGISTRGLGTINETGSVKNVSNFRLICLDVVHQPSVQNAMLESVMESREWVVKDDGSIIECSIDAYNILDKKMKNIPLKNKDTFLREQLLNFINAIKKGVN